MQRDQRDKNFIATKTTLLTEKNMTQKFEMADRFNPSAVEQALYQHWEESGYFKSSGNVPSYCIKQHHFLPTFRG